ncbi:hypothetical protein N7516_006152 [Penicillium verrucosum]|uniref:uncharacterized protein n=1 Tax=Penicillium verrucosum TaxID=60171 RepID=UPI002545072E|nr:uncharacterized protein N7516_006152 [Penicillium verrucosum]KAJ5931663.1 hypothetical protein N7516_006152 [Penicillium verrucosum]
MKEWRRRFEYGGSTGKRDTGVWEDELHLTNVTAHCPGFQLISIYFLRCLGLVVVMDAGDGFGYMD